MEQATITSRGLRLHADLYPAGAADPVVLFLHGTGKYARFYQPFLERLASAGFNVLGLDHQGHGYSEGRRGDFTIPELVQNTRDALAYARRELGPRLALVGSSQGGIVALYTLTEDDSVTSAVCHNAALLNEPETRQIRVSDFSRTVRPLVPFAARLAPWARVPIRRYLPIENIYDDLAVGRLERFDRMVVDSYTLRSFASLATAAPARPVESIQTPTLFLAAEKDRLFPLEYFRSIYDRLTCPKELAIVPNTGHMLFAEHVEPCLPPLIDWLNRSLRENSSAPAD
jgi:pimeloyl-ACP methyl ester carboxylesterase